jgi:hypothetical protein
MVKKIVCFFFIVCISGCQKVIKKPTADKAEFNEGIAVGKPYNKEIDENGGLIDVDIANARVFFLKNSILKTTKISVQPITNTLSNYGLGIRLSSEYRNIKIEFKYPLNGLEPDKFEIYYSQGLEWTKAKNKVIDISNHTITIIQQPDNISIISPSSKVATHVYDYVTK